jgi:competence protein ComGF
MDSPIILKTLAVGLIALLSISCFVNTTKNSSENVEMSPHQDNKLYISKKETHFSSSNTKDKFIIGLHGKDILNSTAKFTITNSQNNIIYTVNFKSKSLLGFDLDANATKAQKEQYIIKRLNTFFCR